jgi:anti-sigma B factor antagonist
MQIQIPTTLLELSTEHDGLVTTLRLVGELDASTAPELRTRLAELYDGGRRCVVLDLSQLDFLDSTGLGVLVGALKRFRHDGGELALRDPRPTVRKVLALTTLDKLFLVA